MRVVRGIEDAAHRLGFRDLLPLGAKQMREPPSFADGDEVIAARLAVLFAFRLDHKILQQAFRCDARGQGFDIGFRMRGLTRVLRGLLQAVQRNIKCGCGFGGLCRGSHGLSPCCWFLFDGLGWSLSVAHVVAPSFARTLETKGSTSR